MGVWEGVRWSGECSTPYCCVWTVLVVYLLMCLVPTDLTLQGCIRTVRIYIGGTANGCLNVTQQ